MKPVFQTDGLGGNLTFTNNFKINNTASGSTIDANGIALTIAGNISDGAGAGKLTIDDRVRRRQGRAARQQHLYRRHRNLLLRDACNSATPRIRRRSSATSPISGSSTVVNANLSGVTSLTNDGGLANFLNATSAGSMTINNINGAQLVFGSLGGTDTATAGSATIINDGSTVGFLANTSAGNATINNHQRRSARLRHFRRHRQGHGGQCDHPQ